MTSESLSLGGRYTDGTYGTYVTYRDAGKKILSVRHDSAVAFLLSLFTFHDSALVQQDAIQCRGDARFGGKLGAPVFWDGVDSEVCA